LYLRFEGTKLPRLVVVRGQRKLFLFGYLLNSRFKLVQRKEHLTPEGFRELLSIKAAINLGFSDTLKEAFPDIIPVEKPKVEDQIISDPN